MFIAYGVRKYKQHQAKKEAEARGEIVPDEEKKKKPTCPSCGETKKIDFVSTTNTPGTKNASCLKCGRQWIYGGST